MLANVQQESWTVVYRSPFSWSVRGKIDNYVRTNTAIIKELHLSCSQKKKSLIAEHVSWAFLVSFFILLTFKLHLRVRKRSAGSFRWEAGMLQSERRSFISVIE